jgi:hypothetical protein
VVSVAEEVLAAEVLEEKEVQHQDLVVAVVLLDQEANQEVRLLLELEVFHQKERLEKVVSEEVQKEVILQTELQEMKDVHQDLVLHHVLLNQVLKDLKDQEEAKK